MSLTRYARSRRTGRRSLALLGAVCAFLLANCSLAPDAATVTSQAESRPTATLGSSTSTTEAATPAATQAAAESTTTATTVASDQTEQPAPTDTAAAATGTASAPPAADATEVATATPADDLASIESLDAVELPPTDRVELARQYGEMSEPAASSSAAALSDAIGTQVQFWVLDSNTDSYRQVSATLQLALEHVLVYVEDGLSVDQSALERSSRVFNDEIYPRNRELFGEEWSPGIDGDPRLTILNVNLSGGVAGYFYSNDEVPRSANRYSNEREMFYMDPDGAQLGSTFYLEVLAHEFQHMIHWNQAKQSAIWFNEGLSELATELNGFDTTGKGMAYISAPDLQLTHWAAEPGESAGHYAAAYLFLSYFAERYGQALDLQELIQAGAGNNLEEFVEQARMIRPEVASFDDIFADWAVANLIDEPGLGDGRWSYRQLPESVEPETADADEPGGDVAQYGVDYQLIEGADTAGIVRFDGSDDVQLAAASDTEGGSWWSNRGDGAASTLTGRFDLSRLQSATLQFRTWYDIEEDYDYGFVSVSRDDGQSWQTLRGQATTDRDRLDTNYGHGYTGASGGSEVPEWIDESIDLTPFAGQTILLRFALISDDAFNKPGMLIDNIRIPELNFTDDAAQASDVWEPAGWIRTDNRLPQRWQLRVVRFDAGSGAPSAVEPVELDAEQQASIRLAAGEQAVLLVMATTPFTTERASYALSTGPAPVSGLRSTEPAPAGAASSGYQRR